MDSQKIYQELNVKGLNASIIAEVIGVLPQSVAVVIRKGKGSKRIANVIATAIDKNLEDVFPFYKQKNERIEQRKVQAANLKKKLINKKN
nr:XRE family transcriptional regulator [Snodgrassella alvi]